MSKHTPGPWLAVGAQVEIEDDSVPDICTCDPQVMRQSHLDWHPRTVEANARLIAAAPDLLEALEGTAALLEALGYAADTSLTVGAARAAIAKAKGSQSYP
jgi:hypothetical protein